MPTKSTKIIRRILIVAIVILTLTLIGIIADGIKEYRSGRNGFSYAKASVKSLEDDVTYGEYDWALKELKRYNSTLFDSDAEKYDGIRALLEYYQWSVIENAYAYIGDEALRAEYEKKANEAKDKVDSDGKYNEYIADIDSVIYIP